MDDRRQRGPNRSLKYGNILRFQCFPELWARRRKEETTHKLHSGQEDRECEGEYDAPKFPIFRHDVVVAI